MKKEPQKFTILEWIFVLFGQLMGYIYMLPGFILIGCTKILDESHTPTSRGDMCLCSALFWFVSFVGFLTYVILKEHHLL